MDGNGQRERQKRWELEEWLRVREREKQQEREFYERRAARERESGKAAVLGVVETIKNARREGLDTVVISDLVWGRFAAVRRVANRAARCTYRDKSGNVVVELI